MKRMKTFLIYLLIFVGFFILSDVLINVSLNTSYHTIKRKDNLEQVTINQAQATKTNLRVKGTITNSKENPITLNYVRVDFYSERNNLVGTRYIDVSNLKENESKDVEIYLRLDEINSYEISFTNNKEVEEVNLLPASLSEKSVLIISVFTLLMII